MKSNKNIIEDTPCKTMVYQYQSAYQAGYLQAQNDLKKPTLSEDTQELYTIQLIKAIEQLDIPEQSRTVSEEDYTSMTDFLNSYQLKINSALSAYQLLDFYRFNNYKEKNIFYLITGIYRKWLSTLDKKSLSEFINDSKRLKYINAQVVNQKNQSIPDYFNIICCLEKSLILKGFLILSDTPYYPFIYNQFQSSIIQYMDQLEGFRNIPPNNINPSKPFLFKKKKIGGLTQFFWHCLTIDILEFIGDPDNKKYQVLIETGQKTFETFHEYKSYHNIILTKINRRVEKTQDTILDKLFPLIFKLYQSPYKDPGIEKYFHSFEEAKKIVEMGISDINNANLNLSHLSKFYHHIHLFTENTLKCK